MSLDTESLSQYAIDRFLEGGELVGRPSYRPLLASAKTGWARPEVLSLTEVQALCEALVKLEAETGMVTRLVA